MPVNEPVVLAERWSARVVEVAGFGHTEAVLAQMAARMGEEFEVSAKTRGYRLREYPVGVHQCVITSVRERSGRLLPC